MSGEYVINIKYSMSREHQNSLPCTIHISVESAPDGCTKHIIPLHTEDLYVTHRHAHFAGWNNADIWLKAICIQIKKYVSRIQYNRLKHDQPSDYTITF